jgi:hypothetical protein
MNEEELKRLIEKYYEGLSTEEDEQTLREYFKRPDVLRGYEAEKVIFSYYTDSEEIPEPEVGFEVRILAGIDASEQNSGFQGLMRYLIPALSVAAGILILAGSYFIFTRRGEASDTFSNPQLAYAETMRILKDVSFQMNRGHRVLEPVGKINQMAKKSLVTLSKSTRIVERNINALDKLQKDIETNKSIDTNTNN